MTDQLPQKRRDIQNLRKNLKEETTRLATVHTAPVENAHTQVAEMETDRVVSEAREKEEKRRKRNRRLKPWIDRMMGIGCAT